MSKNISRSVKQSELNVDIPGSGIGTNSEQILPVPPNKDTKGKEVTPLSLFTLTSEDENDDQDSEVFTPTHSHTFTHIHTHSHTFTHKILIITSSW